jgi:cysteine sulfinate desulfinase/cysteine desulfurase-like protein
MLPYLTHYHGNPHSRTHAYGWESEKAMETARKVSRKILFIFKNYAARNQSIILKLISGKYVVCKLD